MLARKIADILQAQGCRNFVIGEFHDGGKPAGYYVLTPDVTLPLDVRAQVLRAAIAATPSAFINKVRFYSQEDI